MVQRHPGLLRSLPSTLGGSWELLQDVRRPAFAPPCPALWRRIPLCPRVPPCPQILGDRESAESALRQNSTLLKARPSTMQGAWEMIKARVAFISRITIHFRSPARPPARRPATSA